MKRWLLAAAALWVVGWAHGSPDDAVPHVEVGVEVAWAGEGVPRLDGAVLVLLPENELAPAPRTLPVERPGALRLKLPKGSLWRLRIEASGTWSPPAAILADARQPVVRLVLHPAGRVEGRLEARRATLPGEVDVDFSPTEGRGPDGRQTVAVGPEGAWSCALPAGVHDLRLKAAGFASEYIWRVEVQPGQPRSLGTRTLIPGAALAGFVEPRQGVLEAPAVRVALKPVNPETPDPVTRRRLATIEQEVSLERRGFFQFRDLAPGAYRLEVSGPGYALLRAGPFEVQAGRETRLPQPLLLDRPATLHAHVDPATPPNGDGRWRLVLLPDDPRTEASTGEADEHGDLTFIGVVPGPYRLLAESPWDDRWSEQALWLGDGTQHVDVEVPVVAVEGTVTRGGEPVRARITFGDSRSSETVALYSDVDGTFHGALPRAGEWPVRLLFHPGGAQQALAEPVVVEARDGGAARLDIEVPDTRLDGRVIDAEGRPVSHAWVSARPAAGGPASETHSDARGHFLLEGLAEGGYTLRAQSAARTAVRRIEITEFPQPPEVVLRLSESTRIEGIVTTGRGPIAGAEVHGLAWDAARGVTAAHAVSGPLGHFELEVPAGSRSLQLTVLPYGFSARILSLAPPFEGPIEIQVDDGLGGTLEIDTRGLAGTAGTAAAAIGHGAGWASMSALRNWVLFHGGSAGRGEVWRLPAMAVGEYRLCDRLFSTLRCDSGVLTPGATLRLTLPSTSSPAAVGRP